MKLGRCASVLLIIIHVYVMLSAIYFGGIFTVQPDTDDPVTMIVHTLPYLNLKWGICMLQVAVVYFGIGVSWVGLDFPRWFYAGSIIHIYVHFVVNFFYTFRILNALGDMGDSM